MSGRDTTSYILKVEFAQQMIVKNFILSPLQFSLLNEDCCSDASKNLTIDYVLASPTN